MDDMQRKALEQEFEQASARLTEMMGMMPEMEAAYAKYEAASRAGMVSAIYDVLCEEQAECERMEGHVATAQASYDAAKKREDQTGSVLALDKLNAQKLALEHAKAHLEKAKARFAQEIERQGFDSEEAFKAAYLNKPAFMNLEEKLRPFSQEYNTLLERCKEIDALLAE